MNHGSLFSGIGGFDLAAKWMGWDNIFHCEWNPFGQKVLKHHFPKSISYNDIIKTDFTIHRGAIDVLSGGFPCQPYSTAGLRKGKEDERHLWPEMLRAIREIQPSWVVGENVRGLISWGGGLVFDEVQTDLETQGYEVLPFLLPACAVNAPHRRDRIWFVAHANNKRTNSRLGQIQSENGEISEWDNNAKSSNSSYANVANSDLLGCKREREQRGIDKKGARCKQRPWELGDNEFNGWEKFPTFAPICGGNDGIPERLDNITFSKWRNESIKAYGNAIVPQVAHQIFKAINQCNLEIIKSI